MAEAEYIAACSTCSELAWLRNMLVGLFYVEIDATYILCDNRSCIKMIKNPVFYDKNKYIEIRYHSFGVWF